MNSKIELGSKTAKDGFQNEKDVIQAFNDWKINHYAQSWLESMGYQLQDIQDVKAFPVKGSFKSDIQVGVTIIIELKNLTDHQNIQVKLVSNYAGFNQIDKCWVDKYIEMWDIPQHLAVLLKYYTGEILPKIASPKDARRMFADELTFEEQNELLDFLNKNKILILSDIIKGRGQFAAEWILVILKLPNQQMRSVLKPVNYALNCFAEGDVKITKQGNFRIGQVTMQRKGGDGGRKTAQMLQFKINPCLLFDEK